LWSFKDVGVYFGGGRGRERGWVVERLGKGGGEGIPSTTHHLKNWFSLRYSGIKVTLSLLA